MSGVLLCVTAGRGPVECRLAAAHVAAAIVGEAGARGLAVALDRTAQEADRKPASWLLSIEGDGVDEFIATWIGAIQWIAKGLARAHHPRKNWFVAVHRLPAPATTFALNEADVRFEALRAGGPGGQHQNTTASAVRATHTPSGISATARDERSQHRNKVRALRRLRDILAARQERERDAARFREWLSRIVVERGGPVRVYEGEDFSRRK